MNIKKFLQRGKEIKQYITILLLAYKDPRVPWYAKALTAFLLAYILSPIDLIPDFIPIIGYLDDFIIIPLGIYLALRLIPEDVLFEYRKKAIHMNNIDKPKNWLAAVIIIFVWLLLAIFLIKAIVTKYFSQM
ncbi:MAG: YkvA family protein [Syntrophomonadaceae bacterium]|nr:YkvA family protein [Syntrophomonadaceae bacterium]MDD3888753.1 YkvA family protein [Syntrophomonadaceae bacterium]MDD4548178.1 YkvA family protein [Syntrophomonadaceae bacterium]